MKNNIVMMHVFMFGMLLCLSLVAGDDAQKDSSATCACQQRIEQLEQELKELKETSLHREKKYAVIKQIVETDIDSFQESLAAFYSDYAKLSGQLDELEPRMRELERSLVKVSPRRAPDKVGLFLGFPKKRRSRSLEAIDFSSKEEL